MRLILAVALASGCVSTARHERLEVQYEQLAKEKQRLEDDLRRRKAAAERRLAAFKELLDDLHPLVERGSLQRGSL